MEFDIEEMKTRVGAMAFARPLETVTEVFPALCAAISSKRVATMVALSRLVGMVCPGLHSILKSYLLDFTEVDGDDVLRYAALEVCKRMNLVRMRVSGPGIAGEVAAFRRAPPIAQPSMDEIAARVPKGAYAGATVLIVGGSRGLGEVAAKACAAGGANLHITYAVGQADADRVAQEICRHGATCSVHRFDVRSDVRAQLSDISVAPTYLYFFASRSLTRRRAGFLNANDLDDLLRVHAMGFFETCDALLNKAPTRALRAFYPSSSAVADASRGLTEYAMAKAAGEVLCENMNRFLIGADVVCRRLPRMLTDQTANVLRSESSPVLDVMLPIVSEMQLKSSDGVGRQPIPTPHAAAARV
jgi:NADP-dependent 3-hydroxy acid dehydrogenase YdfG